jgi:hypothetical protein
MDYWSIIELLIISDQLNVLGVTGYCILGGNLIKLSPCLRLSFPRDDHQTLTIRPVACAQLQGEAWKKYQKGPAFARSYQDTGAGHWNMRQLAMVTRLFSIFFLSKGAMVPVGHTTKLRPLNCRSSNKSSFFYFAQWATRVEQVDMAVAWPPETRYLLVDQFHHQRRRLTAAKWEQRANIYTCGIYASSSA